MPRSPRRSGAQIARRGAWPCRSSQGEGRHELRLLGDARLRRDWQFHSPTQNSNSNCPRKLRLPRTYPGSGERRPFNLLNTSKSSKVSFVVNKPLTPL